MHAPLYDTPFVNNYVHNPHQILVPNVSSYAKNLKNVILAGELASLFPIPYLQKAPMSN